MKAPDAADPPTPRIPFDRLVEGLSRPEAFGAPRGTPVGVVQTHASVVFLVGERAVKLKKPVRFWDLLDYGTFEQRAHWCREEVRLNRRLAPDIYLGVEPVVQGEHGLRLGGEGEVVEHAVVMRRFDEHDTLGAELAAGQVTEEDATAAARTIAAFHDRERLDPGDADDVVEAFETVLRRNFAGTPDAGAPLFPASVHAGLCERLAAQAAALRPRLRQRVAEGRAVDGHGDLRLEHVLRDGEGGFAIVDCVEFSPLLRRIDGASDLAFLAMDLDEAGRPDLARRLEAAYAEARQDAGAAAVLPLFRGYRAYVRATVDFHASRDTGLHEGRRAAAAAGARRHLALAWTESRADRPPPLVVLHGPSGSGKSVIAHALRRGLRAEVLQSDVVRKALFGMQPTDRPSPEEVARVYAPGVSARVYAALLDGARRALDAGCAAVLDATYLRSEDRSRARRLAETLGVPHVVLDVTCPPPVAEARIRARAARGDDASDAGIAVYREQLATAEPLTPEERLHAVPHDATGAPEATLMALLEHLEARG